MIPHSRRLPTFVFVLLVAGVTVASLRADLLPTAPGTWKPWKATAAPSSLQEQGVSAAQARAFDTELQALNAILKRAPAVATPVGFSVETWSSVAGYRQREHAPGQPRKGILPVAGTLTFGAFPIFEYTRNGKVIREDTGETALLLFDINNIAPDVVGNQSIDEWSGVDRDAFALDRKGTLAGLPRYGDGLVIARDPEALWAPLSLRAALDLVVVARTETVKGAQQSVDAMSARLAKLRDPAYQAKRAKERQADSATMKDPQAFLKQMAEVDRIEEDSLVKDLGPSGGTRGHLVESERQLAEVTTWIASMTPEEQAAPSCYAEKAKGLRGRFRIAPAGGCLPLVRPNYAYFNTSLPRSAPQVVIITPIARCFETSNKYNRDANDPSPAGCRANRGLVETMDIDAIRAWLR